MVLQPTSSMDIFHLMHCHNSFDGHHSMPVLNTYSKMRQALQLYMIPFHMQLFGLCQAFRILT